MSKSVHFELRNPVTPYVCSTPLDFSEERQFLSDVLFPKLNNLCKSRGAYFRPCDLLWKPGDTKAEEGLLLKTFLDAIKQCSPFFICLLGETYGPFRDDSNVPLVLPKNNGKLKIHQEFDWLDKNLVLAGSGGHPWVLQEGNQYKSITELEVTQGVLLSQSPHVTLYYRRSDHLDSKLVLKSEHNPGKYTDLSLFSSESDEAKRKIHDLRQRLVNEGVPVKYFSTLEELGKLVLEDWKEIIDLCLPPLLHHAQLLDTVGYIEWLDQQVFLKRCSELFVSTPDVEDVLKKLTEFASSCTRGSIADTDHDILTTAWNKDIRDFWTSFKPKKEQTCDSHNMSIMLINGDRGTGKSALVAHWLKEFKADNPHICVISHFVSASCRSADIVNFLKYCTRKLQQRFHLSEAYNANSLCATIESCTDSADDSLLCVSESFATAISLTPCVIVLDGVNELSSDKQFDWLPECLPTTCRIIFTSTSSDISHHRLSQRPDTTVLNLPASLKCPSTTVAMIRKHFPTLSDLIGEKTMTRLTQLKLMQTALGSKMIGCELLRFSGYSNMDAFMEENTEVWSLRDFWTICIQNWVTEYSWTLSDAPPKLSFVDGGFCYSGWIIDCLCLIALSRNGLTQDQILSILKMIGYDGVLEVTSYDWLKFRLSASATLQEIGDGRLVFAHKYILEIAEYLLFGSITASSHNPADIIRVASISRCQIYHTYLARYFSQQLLNVQVLQELPWHLMFSGDIISLVNCLTNWNVLMKLMSADSDFWLQDLKLYWSVCQVKGYQPDLEYLRLMYDVGVVGATDVQALDDKYSQSKMTPSMESTTSSLLLFPKAHHKGEIQQTRQEVKDDAHACEEADEAVNRKFSDGVFVTQSHPGSRDQQPLSTGRQHPGGSSQVASLGCFLAKVLERMNQRDVSKTLLSSLVHYIQQNCSMTTETYILLSRSHHFVGQCHEVSGDLDTADKEYKLALHAVVTAIDLDDEMIYDESTQYLKGLLLNCHGNIRILKGQITEAAELLDEARECVKDNPDCFVLRSSIYYNLGLVCSHQYNYNKAEEYLRESIRLRSRWFGWCHPLVAVVLLALAKLLANPSNTRGQNLEQAKGLYKRALHIQEKHFGASHLTVASVLYELGTLLAEENSRLAKVQAQDFLRQSLDIRTMTLGSRHPFTMETQQKLTQVNVALQLKNYEFGCGKYNVSTFAPTNRKPLSAVTLPESGLARMRKKDDRSTTAHFEDKISMWREGHEGLVNDSRPESIMSTMFCLTSASERLLSAPLTEIPRLLQRKKQNHLCQGLKQQVNTEIDRKDENHIYIVHAESGSKMVAENELPQIGSSMTINQRSQDDNQCGSMNADAAEDAGSELNEAVNLNSQKIQPITFDIQHKGENGDISKETNEEMLGHPSLDSYSKAVGTAIENKDKKTISIHPSSAPQRLLQRYRKYSLVDRPQTSVTKERSTPNSMHRLWSGRSSNAAASSYSSSHLSHCYIPGRHDITVGNSQSISGPHSDLTSLLGDPPCPRQTLHRLHHRAAWYHVPGRYATPQHPFPSRRMQRTKTSKDIESYMAIKCPDHKSKLQEPKEGQEDITNELGKENLFFNGTYLLHSGSKMFSNGDNLSVHAKFIFRQNSDRSMMVSGLEMPRVGHPEHKSASKSQAVKFKNNIKA